MEDWLEEIAGGLCESLSYYLYIRGRGTKNRTAYYIQSTKSFARVAYSLRPSFGFTTVSKASPQGDVLLPD